MRAALFASFLWGYKKSIIFAVSVERGTWNVNVNVNVDRERGTWNVERERGTWNVDRERERGSWIVDRGT